jgi:hypothetical protein
MKIKAFRNKDRNLLEVCANSYGKLGICIKYDLSLTRPNLKDEFEMLYKEYWISLEKEDIEPLIEMLKEIKEELYNKSKTEEK